MRYNHPFWNSPIINFVATKVSKFNSWLWFKQYGPKQ